MHGGDIYRNKVEYDFSVNLNPAGIPSEVNDALQEALSHISEYPDLQYRTLRNELSKFWNVPEDRILLGNGASELITATILSLRPKTCLLTAPAYTGYENVLRQNLPACEIQHVHLAPEDGFAVKESLLQAIRRIKPDLLILTNPNNPNGLLIPQDVLEETLLAAKETGTILLMDECFLALTGEDATRSLIHRNPESLPETIVLRAFTKTFAIPGVRVGYAITSGAALAARVSVPLPEWNLSVLAEKAGAACLACGDFVVESAKLVGKERAYLTSGLTKLGLEVYPSDANYILFRAEDSDLSLKLLSKGILIRPCDDFHGLTNHHYRVAVMDRVRNEKLLAVLEEVISISQSL